jgi:oligopeptide/dipeptide ABC transporter ATP-binding protein
MVLLEVKSLRVYYYTPRSIVRAVDGVDIYVERGESLCIVGESGSGKSTLGLSIAGLIEPPGRVIDGEVIFDGEVIVSSRFVRTYRYLGKRMTMIFQDPRAALNPVMRIGDQIAEGLAHSRGMKPGMARERVLELLRSVEIPDPNRVVNSYPHELSGGMAQRVVIAIAISTEPDLIIADEPTSALDVTVQAQILRLLKRLVRESGRSLIFITHDLSVAMEICDRIAIMYAGKIVEEGSIKDIIEKPLHPYTIALLGSIPRMGSKRSRLSVIPGEPPDMGSPPSGCRFHPRCALRFHPCDRSEPALIRYIDGRRIACFLYGGGDEPPKA